MPVEHDGARNVGGLTKFPSSWIRIPCRRTAESAGTRRTSLHHCNMAADSRPRNPEKRGERAVDNGHSGPTPALLWEGL